MPIYEFYCKKCHTIFNFFSQRINTDKVPFCPHCEDVKLEKRMSLFATPRDRGDEDDMPMPDMDEAKLEKAMNALAGDFEQMDENDPRQAADMMRKLTDMTGLNLGPGMEEALQRMEAGEDPEKVEAEMGDLLEDEEPFTVRKASAGAARRLPPRVDEKLYDL